MKITKEEIVPVAEAVKKEVEAIYNKLSKRDIPFIIAYTIGTNSGEPWTGSYSAFIAPGGYNELAILHHELIMATSGSMLNNKE